jgi:hypothetical protein
MGGTIAPASDTRSSSFIQLDLKPSTNRLSGQKELQAEIALRRLGMTSTEKNRCIWVAAETRLAAKLPVVDRVGYRAFDMSDTIVSPAR